MVIFLKLRFLGKMSIMIIGFPTPFPLQKRILPFPILILKYFSCYSLSCIIPVILHFGNIIIMRKCAIFAGLFLSNITFWEFNLQAMCPNRNQTSHMHKTAIHLFVLENNLESGSVLSFTSSKNVPCIMVKE